MPRSLAVALALALQVTTGPPPPSGRDLCAAGDYRRAAAILHPLVMDLPARVPFPDADATKQLASMYQQGLGVPSDPVLACSLFDMASRSAMDTGPYPHDLEGVRRREARQAQFERQRQEQCAVLSDGERHDALRLLGMFTASVPEQRFSIGPGHTVIVNRMGIVIHDNNTGAPVSDPVPVTGRWGVADAPEIRFTHLEPPAATTSRARDFVEVWAWSRAERDGRRLHHLEWMLWEVTGGQLRLRASEALLEESTLIWPLPQVPSDLAFSALSMTVRGEVRWSVGEPVVARGVVER